MAGTKFEITGVKELQRAFKELPKRLANKVVRQSIRKALAPIKEAAFANAPRETGYLASKIVIRAMARRKRGVIGVEVRVGEGEFKGKAFYGGFLEYGTSEIAPLHFMLRAYESHKDSALRTVKQLILDGLEREASALKKG